MYIESYVAPDAGEDKLTQKTEDALKSLVNIALTLSDIKHLTGRNEPTGEWSAGSASDAMTRGMTAVSRACSDHLTVMILRIPCFPSTRCCIVDVCLEQCK